MLGEAGYFRRNELMLNYHRPDIVMARSKISKFGFAPVDESHIRPKIKVKRVTGRPIRK